MTKLQSRTITLTDEDWEIIGQASIEMGNGPRGRGKTMVTLAMDFLLDRQRERDD